MLERVLIARSQGGQLCFAPFQSQADHCLYKLTLEGFQAARLEGPALDGHLASGCEERVVLHLVAIHRGVFAIEFDVDARGQIGREAGPERGQLRRGVGPGQAVRRRHKVDTIRIDLDGVRIMCLEPVDHLLQQLASVSGNRLGRIEIAEACLAEPEVAVK